MKVEQAIRYLKRLQIDNFMSLAYEKDLTDKTLPSKFDNETLVKVQQAIVEQIESELHEGEEPNTVLIEYMRECKPASACRPVMWSSLESALCNAEIVYVGDFHDCTEPKEVLVEILERVNNPFLAMEYPSLLENLPGIPITGLSNSRSKIDVYEFDRQAARTISRLRESYPKNTIVVYAGDYHIMPEHLPSCFSDRQVIVQQNTNTTYWKFMHDRGAPEKGIIVRLPETKAAQQFCVFTLSPIETGCASYVLREPDEFSLPYTELANRIYRSVLAFMLSKDSRREAIKTLKGAA